jgi:hypothetical protein
MNYMKFRKIVLLLAKNDKLRKLIETGEIELDFTGFCELLEDTDLDAAIIEIMTGKKADKVDAVAAMEILGNFFTYIGSNLPRLESCLKNLGLKQVELEAAGSTG